MAKPKRYPRKLRMKLEKIRAERAEREGRETDEIDQAFKTLWHEFLGRDSVELMATNFDNPRRIRTRYVMRLQRSQAVTVRPPWFRETLRAA